MKTLLGLILAGALFVGGAVPVLATPRHAWHPPTVLCERLETIRENPKALRWAQRLPFTTIDCSVPTPNPDE